MSQINKILAIIFFILIVVVIGEVGYYYFLSDRKTSTKFRAGQQNSVRSVSPTTMASGLQVCVSPRSDSPLNTVLLEELKAVSNFAITSSRLNNQYQGFVAELNLNGGQNPIDKTRFKNSTKDFYDYEIGLKIRDEKNTRTLSFYLDNRVVSKIKVLQQKGEERIPITINDLKLGDKVILNETVDLMNKNCIESQCLSAFTIIKQ